MNYFSIDSAIENIKNIHSKYLFKEVHSSYAMGNYRSAVVMLWSVVVTDLVLKLKELEMIYDDQKAIAILDIIKKEQDKDIRSSKWELLIIEKFQKELHFLDTPEVTQLKFLQETRHISAHPVIRSNDMLHSPSRSTVYSLMQSALESVLMKDALFSAKVNNYIIQDLVRSKNFLFTLKDKETYFCRKFLNRMSSPVLIQFIKVLWKLSFILRNSDADQNRENVIDYLDIILEKRAEDFYTFMKNNKEYISINNPDAVLTQALLTFLVFRKNILKYFDLEFIEELKKLLSEKPFFYNEYLLFNTPLDYCKYLDEKNYEFLPVLSLEALAADCEHENISGAYLSVCINGYAKAKTFSLGDHRFKRLIEPNINFFTLDQLKDLIEKVNVNDQACFRGKAIKDHRLIIDRVLQLDSSFDFNNYSDFTLGNEAMVEEEIIIKKVKKIDIEEKE